MVIRDGEGVHPQAPRSRGDVRGERRCLRWEIEPGRRATTIRECSEALAYRAIAEGWLFVFRQGDGNRALTDRGGFHRRDDTMTE